MAEMALLEGLTINPVSRFVPSECKPILQGGISHTATGLRSSCTMLTEQNSPIRTKMGKMWKWQPLNMGH